MGRFARVTEHRFVCRIVNGHKWERFQTSQEEAYRCVRCGRRHFGKLNKLRFSDIPPTSPDV